MMKERLNGSTEVRWFFKNDYSEPPLDWFLDGLPGRKSVEFKNARHYEDKRVDDYLVLPGSQVVGVKLRERTKLEIKALVLPPAPVNFGIFEGRADQWIKWTSEREALKTVLKPQRSKNWQSVAKWRYLRKFSADFEQIVEIAPSTKLIPNSGFNVELTLLEVDTLWKGFTFGFEAFGPKLNSLKGLRAAVLFFLEFHPPSIPMSLTLKNSLNFPAWISSIAKRSFRILS